jgi:hypothetical protein
MDIEPEPQPLDLAYRLPKHTFWQAIQDLRASLPAPADNTPEALAHRDNAAIANVASMLPANASEVTLATQFVLASAHAGDCMRLAMLHPASIAEGLHCRALSVSMMRQAQSARRLLMRVQAERHKREADPAASEKAAWIEHCAIELMAEALPSAPPAKLRDPPVPPPPEPQAEPEHDGEPRFDPVTAAEEYAMIYPQRAALIRRLGRLPDKPGFGPPADRLVRALVTLQTPALLALDQEYAGKTIA